MKSKERSNIVKVSTGRRHKQLIMKGESFGHLYKKRKWKEYSLISLIAFFLFHNAF